MAVFRVSFFNTLTNSCGRVLKVCQRTVEIDDTHDVNRALETAKQEFARLERIPNWGLRAQSVEVEEIQAVA